MASELIAHLASRLLAEEVWRTLLTQLSGIVQNLDALSNTLVGSTAGSEAPPVSRGLTVRGRCKMEWILRSGDKLFHVMCTCMHECT